MMKQFRFILLSLLLVGAVSFFDAPRTGAQAPASAAEMKAAGLRARVTVRRDERSIPYIEAASHHDLYFAQGYVTAGDRLWQMDLLRRSARG